MLQGEHSAILSTFIKLPFVIKVFVLSIFELPFYAGFTIFVEESSVLCLLAETFPLLLCKQFGYIQTRPNRMWDLILMDPNCLTH